MTASSRYRTDRRAQNGPTQGTYAGWSRLAALQASMDLRARVRLAGQLQATDRTLRSFADNLSWVLSYRLLHVRLTEGFEIA